MHRYGHRPVRAACAFADADAGLVDRQLAPSSSQACRRVSPGHVGQLALQGSIVAAGTDVDQRLLLAAHSQQVFERTSPVRTAPCDLWRLSVSSSSSLELKSMSYWRSSRLKIEKVMSDEPRPATTSMRPGAMAAASELLKHANRVVGGEHADRCT